ncbi:MAG TPA: hypothetical protein DDW50_21205 [Firmicutes bacterium]|jgi:hypothetical protein|nr:hypothetical protein [Bacillota bacterium]
MALSIVKVEELPLGSRILRFGNYGQDVIEMQKILQQSGFYFGECDGWYGILTGEAVCLLQRTFHLRTDGIAGPEVFDILGKKGLKKGRIIYWVKKNEGLELLSSRFGVRESAWKRIPGQGDPHKKTYPGLKMLLHEKIFLSGDLPCSQEISFQTSGTIRTDYQITIDGKSVLVTQLQNERTFSEPLFYHGIGALREVWETLLSSPHLWTELAFQLKKVQHLKFGFDLREAPIEKFPCLKKFLVTLCRKLKLSELEFQIVPFLPVKGKFENRLYWLNLPIIGSYTKYILVEPRYNTESPDLFRESVATMLKDTVKFVKIGLAERIILICQITGWNWNLDQNHFEKLSYKAAKLYRGQYTSNVQYFPDSKLCSIDYVKHHHHYCLIYRDDEGWREFLNQIPVFNLAGVAMIGFRDLGKAGPEIITGSFKVQRWDEERSKFSP